MVERNLAKVEVASSSLVSRSTRRDREASEGFPFCLHRIARSGICGILRDAPTGGVAERLCSGLQIRLGRFDSDPRLHHPIRSLRRPTQALQGNLYSCASVVSSCRRQTVRSDVLSSTLAQSGSICVIRRARALQPIRNAPVIRSEEGTYCPSGGIGRHKGLEQLSPRGETPGVTPVKVGEGPDHVPQLVELTPNQAR